MSNEGRSNFGYVGDDNSKADYKRNEPEAATTSTSAESRRSLKISVLKNVVLISISFMLLFTSYQSMAALQSSINKDSGLGTYSLSVTYAALIVSSMFAPSWVIGKLGSKWAMVFSMLCYSLFIIAQFYPQFYTLIPAAIILGAAAAPLWIAKCDYLTKLGNVYANEVMLNPGTVEQIIVKFFGIFFMFFQTSLVWGPLIAAYALGIGREDKDETTEKDLSTCGIYFCPSGPANDSATDETTDVSDAVNENFKTTKTQIYTMAGIFLACSLIGPLVIAVLVDPLTKFHTEGEDEKDKKAAKTALDLIKATFNHVKNNTNQQLLILLTIWSGLEQGFFGADFTAGYVSCGWGVDKVGFVIVTYGICDAIGSFSLGYVIKRTGRVPIFMFGAILNIIVIVILFLWHPDPDKAYIFFILAGLWGIADSVWQTQINALYGVIFEGEESSGGFSNYRLWESVGFIAAYILQTQVCIYAKLWVLVIELVCGMALYLVVEYREKNRQN